MEAVYELILPGEGEQVVLAEEPIDVGDGGVDDRPRRVRVPPRLEAAASGGGAGRLCAGTRAEDHQGART
jgi:hypothetical protein